jgi:hypothetical protein
VKLYELVHDNGRRLVCHDRGNGSDEPRVSHYVVVVLQGRSAMSRSIDCELHVRWGLVGGDDEAVRQPTAAARQLQHDGACSLKRPTCSAIRQSPSHTYLQAMRSVRRGFA